MFFMLISVIEMNHLADGSCTLCIEAVGMLIQME